MNRHLEWIDSWKGVLIFLVVLGHVVGAGTHFSEGTSRIVCEVVYRGIYTFHMSAFFFLAGMTWKMRGKGWPGVRTTLESKAFRLLVPYVVFGLFSAIVFVFLVGGFQASTGGAKDAYYADKTLEAWWVPFVSLVHAGGWPRGEGFRMNSVLWFLPCMFMTVVAFDLVLRLERKCVRNLCCWVMCALALLAIRTPGLTWPWGLHALPYYFCYMLLGHFSSRWLCQLEGTGIYSLEHKGWWRLMAFGGGVLYLVIVGLMPDLWMRHKSLVWLAAFEMMCLVGIVMSVLCAKCWTGRLLGALGRASLGIMLLHKFIVVGMQFKLGWMRQWFVDGGWGLAFGIFVTTGVAVVVSFWGALVVRTICPIALGEKRLLSESRK